MTTSKELWEQISSRYDTEERINNAEIITKELRKEFENINNTKEMTLLDYGCGTGLVGLELTELFNEVVLVDLSSQMVEQVEMKIEKRHISNAKAQAGDFVENPEAYIKPDIIIMAQVLLHIPDTKKILTNLFGMLKNKGILFIIDYDKNERVVTDRIHNGFDKGELSQMLQDIGYADVFSHTFYHGEKMLMKEDASLFLLKAEKDIRN